MWRGLGIAILIALSGCDDCGVEATPAIQGLCEPRLAVGTSTTVAVVYESDSGPMPLEATRAVAGDPAVATIAIGPTGDHLKLDAIAIGSTTIELALRGYNEPVWFTLSVEPTPPVYRCDGRDPPGFDLTNRGPAPAP